MKKILLIEDRIKRQEDFLDDASMDMESYDDILDNQTDKDFYKKILKDEIDLYKYQTIISHKSVGDEDSVQVIDKLKSHCKITSTPLVLFSGGISTNFYSNDNYEMIELNSKTFYSQNLQIFLDAMKNNEQNLLILCYGQKWKLNIALNALEKINRFIEKNDKKEEIKFSKLKLEIDMDKLKQIDYDFCDMNIENGWLYLKDIIRYRDSILKYIKENANA